jgi:hypothetical protein
MLGDAEALVARALALAAPSQNAPETGSKRLIKNKTDRSCRTLEFSHFERQRQVGSRSNHRFLKRFRSVYVLRVE